MTLFKNFNRKLLVLAGALGLGVILVGSSSLWADDEDEKHGKMDAKRHVMIAPDDIEWSEGPASLPKGAELALLSGDPAKEGPFTMRLRLPAGYRIPPHWHPRHEHVTVLAGSFHMGLGEELDRHAGQALGVGGFAFMAPEVRHFAWTERGATIQVHGVGPWGIEYVNPEDDPRRRER